VIDWVRRAAKRTPLSSIVRWWRGSLDDVRRDKQRRITPHPPTQAEKYATILKYANDHGLRTLVETGTNEGDAVWACLTQFERIYSIELSPQLREQAADRFRANPHVEILQGDSTTVLPAVLESIREPSLFWLDGHWSGGATARGRRDTPVVAEIRTILRHAVKGHVVLVDDARLFYGWDDYPTLAGIKRIVMRSNPNADYVVENDIIRIVL
jgi:hypothetical protein